MVMRSTIYYYACTRGTPSGAASAFFKVSDQYCPGLALLKLASGTSDINCVYTYIRTCTYST